LSTTGIYAVRTPGVKGQPGRYIKVEGSPIIPKGFRPSSVDHDMALLKLAMPISEFTDGVCFLCLPMQEVTLGCLKDACFVVAPHYGKPCEKIE
jgi:hypothetical protein